MTDLTMNEWKMHIKEAIESKIEAAVTKWNERWHASLSPIDQTEISDEVSRFDQRQKQYTLSDDLAYAETALKAGQPPSVIADRLATLRKGQIENPKEYGLATVSQALSKRVQQSFEEYRQDAFQVDSTHRQEHSR